jgi:hypothetical protein
MPKIGSPLYIVPCRPCAWAGSLFGTVLALSRAPRPSTGKNFNPMLGGAVAPLTNVQLLVAQPSSVSNEALILESMIFTPSEDPMNNHIPPQDQQFQHQLHHNHLRLLPRPHARRSHPNESILLHAGNVKVARCQLMSGHTNKSTQHTTSEQIAG